MCDSGSDTETDSDTSDGGTSQPSNATPSDTSESCPETKSIRGHFIETEVKCGDPASVEAQGVNITEGSSVSFSVYRTRDFANLDSLSGQMNAQQSTVQWHPRQPTDARAGDAFLFDVSADGESGHSSNNFHFTPLANQGPEEKSWRCTSGVFGWDAKFEIRFTADTLYVKVKIKLVNWTGNTPEAHGTHSGTVSDADKTTMKNDIESRLNNHLFLTRRNCYFGEFCTCMKPVVVEVEFVESGQHHIVNFYQGQFGADSAHWARTKYRDTSWAHETGHLMGWYDEYPGGATGSSPRWQADESANLMGCPGGTIPSEYGWDFRDWLATKTGEPWNV